MTLSARLQRARTDENLRRPSRRNVMVRMQRELHAALKHQAWQEKVSLNDLCVAIFEEALESLKPQAEAVGQ